MIWTSCIADCLTEGQDTSHGINMVVSQVSKEDTIIKLLKVDSSFFESDSYKWGEGDSIYSALNSNPNKAPDENWVKSISDLVDQYISKYHEQMIRFGHCLILRMDRISMPDGTDGMKCIQCGDYYPYVEPNSDNGYICFMCKK